MDILKDNKSLWLKEHRCKIISQDLFFEKLEVIPDTNVNFYIRAIYKWETIRKINGKAFHINYIIIY